MTARETIAAEGACVVRGAIGLGDVAAIAEEFGTGGRAGARGAEAGSSIARLISPDGPLGRLACALSGRDMRPVRVVRFDKTAAANWFVPWHQDRTIAVERRADVAGFGPWSVKAGVLHVEPPVAILNAMLTLRVFVDPCGEDQGPLKVALGSHAFGRAPAGDVATLAAGLPILVATGAPGDVLAMHPLAIHASERSRSSAGRRVMHVDYAADPLPSPLAWALR